MISVFNKDVSANSVTYTSIQSHCPILVCLPAHLIAHLCILSSQVQVLPGNHTPVQFETVLGHHMQGWDTVTP